MSVADDEIVARLIALARQEDLGSRDVSAELLPDADQRVIFRLIARETGVFAGCEIAQAVLRAYDESIEIEWACRAADGAAIAAPATVLATIRGPLGPVLSAERVLLNFLQRLCGVATLTRRFVEAVAGTGAMILDTRKTIPGWRSLDKYAVHCGGGANHRMGLYDAVILKDNHVSGCDHGSLAAAVFDCLNRLSAGPERPDFIEVEAESPAQVEELFRVVGIDVIMLDNFSLDDVKRAVARRDELGLKGKIALEASGGVTLADVRALAATGVERISVGAITHSAAALDLSLERC